MAKKVAATKIEKTGAEKWLDKISRAQKVREEWRTLFRIPLCYDYWEGRQRPANVNDNEWITINMIYSNLQAELPGLYSTDPYYYIKLKTSYSVNPMDIAMYEAKAKVRQSMVNYLKGELNLKSKARLSIFDAHFQYGVCKVVYDADLVENPDAGQKIMQPGTEVPMLGDDGNPLLEPDTIPANERYKICRLHPDDFLVDEDAGPLDENVSWKAERIKRPLEDVKKDKTYTDAGRKAIKATEVKDEAAKAREQRKKGGLATGGTDDPEPDTVVLWELYDLKNKQWLVVAEGCKEFLIEPEPVPVGTEGDPYIDLRFTLRDDSWYPLPPISQWVDPQRDYCEFRSKLKTHLKRFNRKYEAYMPGLDDDSELSKVENGDDGTIIRKNQPTAVITPISDAPYDQQIHTNIAYLRHDFEDVATGPNQRGSSSGVDSATEAGILERRTQLREGDKVGLVMDFLSGIGRKLDQIVEANITKDQAVKVTGVQGEYWELVRTEDYGSINGEYEYSINVGSTTPQLPEIERAQWNAFLGLLAQAPQLATSKQLLTRMAEMHHINDDVMIEELYKIGQMMMQMQAQGLAAKGVGSQPNVTQQNPMAIGGGTAAGINNVRGGAQ